MYFPFILLQQQISFIDQNKILAIKREMLSTQQKPKKQLNCNCDIFLHKNKIQLKFFNFFLNRCLKFFFFEKKTNVWQIQMFFSRVMFFSFSNKFRTERKKSFLKEIIEKASQDKKQIVWLRFQPGGLNYFFSHSRIFAQKFEDGFKRWASFSWSWECLSKGKARAKKRY